MKCCATELGRSEREREREREKERERVLTGNITNDYPITGNELNTTNWFIKIRARYKQGWLNW